MRQIDQIRKVKIGEEFRIKIPNSRIYKVRSDFIGTPIHINCTSGTGIFSPDIVLHPDSIVAEIAFKENYLKGDSYSFIIGQQEKGGVKTYSKPPVKKSIAGLQYFRAEVSKSQESLDQKFSGNALSFDQSYFTRTIGQIVIQYRLEQKLGNLTDEFDVFSGAGFGSLQAFSCALNYKTEELNDWYLGDLLKIIRKNYLQTGFELTTSVFLNHDNRRIKSKKVEDAIRYLFKAKDSRGKRTNRDLTIKDCRKDVYIPVWDISRKTVVITKDTCPDMEVYFAVCSAMLDPITFSVSKRMLKRWNGVLNGDIVKNNDVYLKKFNSLLDVTSIGSPVRVWDKGNNKIDERSKLIKLTEVKHDTDLDWSRSCGSARYECTPVDELLQMSCSDKSIGIAQKSGGIDV